MKKNKLALLPLLTLMLPLASCKAEAITVTFNSNYPEGFIHTVEVNADFVSIAESSPSETDLRRTSASFLYWSLEKGLDPEPFVAPETVTESIVLYATWGWGTEMVFSYRDFLEGESNLSEHWIPFIEFATDNRPQYKSNEGVFELNTAGNTKTTAEDYGDLLKQLDWREIKKTDYPELTTKESKGVSFFAIDSAVYNDKLLVVDLLDGSDVVKEQPEDTNFVSIWVYYISK